MNMMDQEDALEYKQKISNGFADSILASSPTINGTMNANSFGDGVEFGEQDISKKVKDMHFDDNSGSSDSESPSTSPESCSPCPSGDEKDQADQNDSHVIEDPLWQVESATLHQFTNKVLSKDGDSGFISPEGIPNGAIITESPNNTHPTTLPSDQEQTPSGELFEFQSNTHQLLDMEIIGNSK